MVTIIDYGSVNLRSVQKALERVGVEARITDDDGFSNKHLEVTATICYEAAKLEIQHVVWAIPGAAGLRTQLRVRALPGFDAKAARVADRKITDCGGTLLIPGARADHLPLDFTISNSRR